VLRSRLVEGQRRCRNHCRHSGPLKTIRKFLALIAAGRSTSHYRKNTSIFVQGADADTVIYIQDGQVKVTVTSEHGKEAILALLGPGQFFGEGCLSGQRHRKATTTTMTDCRLTSIEKDSMLKALQESSQDSPNSLWTIS
jgi:CRP/FNR family transcriptional regulator, cyclic AMP receptor protein